MNEHIRKLLPRSFLAPKPPADHAHNHKTTISNELLESAQADIAAVLQRLRTETNGLTAKEARARIKHYGPNEIAKEKTKSTLMRLISNVKNPLVILLLVLGLVSYLTGDIRPSILQGAGKNAGRRGLLNARRIT